jgi:hypothetical protein
MTDDAAFNRSRSPRSHNDPQHSSYRSNDHRRYRTEPHETNRTLCAMRANRLVDPKPKSELLRRRHSSNKRCSPTAVRSLIVLMETFGSRPQRHAGQGRKGGAMSALWRRLSLWWLCRRISRLAIHKGA